MALQQAQMLLSMNSLESLSAGVQQNNTESFAVALCHLAELHAEQVGRVCSFVLCCHGKIPAETNLKGRKPMHCAVQVAAAEAALMASKGAPQVLIKDVAWVA